MMKINKIIYMIFLILIIFYISNKIEGYQNINKKYNKILTNIDKDSRKIYDKDYKQHIYKLNDLNERVNVCNKICFKNILKFDKKISIKDFRKLRNYCDNKCLKQITKEDRYKEDRYKEDQYKEDRYKEDRYKADQYKEDRYKEDQYKEDRYKEDQYKEDRYKEDQYNKDTYADSKYTDNKYTDNKYTDNKYTDSKRRPIYNKHGYVQSSKNLNKYCNDTQVQCYSQNNSNNGICGTCVNGYLFGCPNKCKNINCKNSRKICN